MSESRLWEIDQALTISNWTETIKGLINPELHHMIGNGYTGVQVDWTTKTHYSSYRRGEIIGVRFLFTDVDLRVVTRGTRANKAGKVDLDKVESKLKEIYELWKADRIVAGKRADYREKSRKFSEREGAILRDRNLYYDSRVNIDSKHHTVDLTLKFNTAAELIEALEALEGAGYIEHKRSSY